MAAAWTPSLVSGKGRVRVGDAVVAAAAGVTTAGLGCRLPDAGATDRAGTAAGTDVSAPAGGVARPACSPAGVLVCCPLQAMSSTTATSGAERSALRARKRRSLVDARKPHLVDELQRQSTVPRRTNRYAVRGSAGS